MPKKGLISLTKIYPVGTDKFIFIKRFRFVPYFSKKVAPTIIDLEIYDNNICVLSFFTKGSGIGKDKYKIRKHLGSGHIKGIFKACIEAYFSLSGYHALIFSSANDIGLNTEDNARNSAYRLFLSYSFPNYSDYEEEGSLLLNTMLMYHKDFLCKKEARNFYSEFKIQVEEELNDSNTII